MELLLGPLFLCGTFAGFIMGHMYHIALLNRYQDGDY